LRAADAAAATAARAASTSPSLLASSPEALAVQVERAGRGNDDALEVRWQRVALCLGRGPRTDERDGHTGRQATRLRPSTMCAIHLASMFMYLYA
jgi:hypothetical protein